MRILQVIPGLRKAAGTTTFVEQVVRELRALGHEVVIVRHESELSAADIVHIHGMWSPLLHRASVFARRRHIPVVWSTHGMTAPWSMRHKWWKKLPAWWLYQRRDLKAAQLIHCTTDLETEWNRQLGLSRCLVAPLGTEMPPTVVPLKTLNDRPLQVLFVGRIYPVKGLANVVRAAALLQAKGEGPVAFRIVGPDQAGHLAELQRLAAELQVESMFTWAGPKFGAELASEYDGCDVLILPSFTENFGGVVADALAHGRSVIASRFTPWQVLEQKHCGWWTDNAPESLAAALALARAMPDAERAAMGERGRALVAERFAWPQIARMLVAGYEREVTR